MIKLIPSTVFLFLLLLNPGCGIPIGTIRSDVPDKLEHFSALIKPGTTNRSDTRDLLGVPLFSSDKWSVEVYRAARGKNTEWALVGLFPAFESSRDVTLYGMILYDLNDVVKEAEWLIYEERNSYRIGVGDVNLIVREEDYELGGRSEYIFLGENASKTSLFESSPSDRCQITFGLVNDVVKISIDNKSIIDGAPHGMLYKAKYGYVHHVVQPGDHEIVIKTSIFGYRPNEFSFKYTCIAGDAHYAYLDTELIPTNEEGVFVDKYKKVGSIIITKAPPKIILNGLNLLYQSVKWRIH